MYLGLDLGTSGLKGVALTETGAIAGSAAAAYPTARPEPGAAEQDPADWVAAARAVLARLARVTGPAGWRGIGLSGMLPTLVPVTAAGTPAGPAITWQDSRAGRSGDQLRERLGGDLVYQETGQWLDGRYLVPMFLRLAAREPAQAAATARLLGAKDYLFWWLTGTAATDPSTAAGTGCYQLSTGDWLASVLAAAESLAGRALPALPPVLSSAEWRPLRGELAAALHCGQIPVCLGAADSVLGAAGLGARATGQIACIAGTSTVILGVTGDPRPEPAHRYLVTPLAEPGCSGLEMDLLATGSAISWLAGLLGTPDEASLVALAAGTDPTDAPLVLPYLTPGEQGALWDPALSGAITGLELRHGPEHLARGLISGIILEIRRCLTVLAQTGQFGTELRVAGGSGADPGFRADLADATGYRVTLPADGGVDCSARGAAALAVHAVDGRWPVPAADSPVAEPDRGRAARWDDLWERYERARTALTGAYRAPARPAASAG